MVVVEVIQHSTEKKGDNTYEDNQNTLAGRGNPRGDHSKAIMGINNLNNGHGTKQKKDNLGGGCKILIELLCHQKVIARGNSVNGHHAGAQQGGADLLP
ncbi:MAG: hypothetical protein R2861_15780 [Desulfobacterales bacterium]